MHMNGSGLVEVLNVRRIDDYQGGLRVAESRSQCGLGFFGAALGASPRGGS